MGSRPPRTPRPTIAFGGAALLALPGLVMVPRPATDTLVVAAAERVGGRRLRVADVGTGSGALAVALALRAPQAEIRANLPYLPAALAEDDAYAEYRQEPFAAVFAVGDGLEPYRQLLVQAEAKLTPDGALLLQLHRRVFAATRDELAGLAERLERAAPAAAA